MLAQVTQRQAFVENPEGVRDEEHALDTEGDSQSKGCNKP